MRCICIGDVHIKVGNVLETDEMIKNILEIANKTRPNFIVLLGDVLDRHSNIHVSCLMKSEVLIHSLSQIAPVFVLIGNHDRPNNSNFLTDEHPFNSLKLWPNTYIVDKPIDVCISNHLIHRISSTSTLSSLSSWSLNGVDSFTSSLENNSIQLISKDNYLDSEYRFIFLPYVAPGRLQEALNKLENNSLNSVACVFAHQEIINCKMGAIISSIGDKWPLENPLMVSGHIHDYDLLQPNMIYTGTPLQHSFADRDDKTISIFSFNKQENTIQWSQERVDLNLIKKITVYITPEKLPFYEPPLNKLVRLVVKGEEAEIKTVSKLAKIGTLKKQGVKVVFKTVLTNEPEPSPSTLNRLASKITYRERLLSEIDPSLTSWFNKIF